MKKDDKILLWVIGIMLIIINPGIIVIGIIALVLYSKYKDKYKLNDKISNIKEKYKNSTKTHPDDVIDTTAEVIDSKVVEDDEWKATKEYRR